MSFLQIGDVIDIQRGMSCYSSIPEKFVYANRRASEQLTKTEIKIGKVLTNELNIDKAKVELQNRIKEVVHNIGGFAVSPDEIDAFIVPILERHTLEKLDTGEVFDGEYVVIKTAMTGGGTGHGQYDVYPDGHYVICKKLKDGIFDKDGVIISFYQSGCFTVMIEPSKIQPKRRMEMNFI